MEADGFQVNGVIATAWRAHLTLSVLTLQIRIDLGHWNIELRLATGRWDRRRNHAGTR